MHEKSTMKHIPRIASLTLLMLVAYFRIGLTQTPTQVIVAAGGATSATGKVMVGAWDLSSGNYTIFDSIAAGSAHSVHIHGRDAYVCADSFLVRYNLDSYTREATAKIKGVRQVAVWEDKVLVAKGLGATADHFEVRYAENLYWCFSVPSLVGNCEGVVVVGDTGYVANPVSFASPTGNLAVIDMPGRVLDRNMSLDTMGKFIDNLHSYQGKVVTVNRVKINNPVWGFVSIYDPSTGATVHHKVSQPVGRSIGVDGNLLFGHFGGNIKAFDLATGQLMPGTIIPGTWAGSALDSLSDHIYVTRTDFQTYGWLYRYDYTGSLLDSLEVGPSPEALAVDYDVIAGGQTPPSGSSLSLFPQPAGDRVFLDLRSLKPEPLHVQVANLAGQTVMEAQVRGGALQSLDLSGLEAGAYVVTASTKSSLLTAKLIKASH